MNLDIELFDDQLKETFFKKNFKKQYIHIPQLIKNHKNVMSLEIFNKMLSIQNIWNNKNFLMMLDREIINFSEYASQTLDIGTTSLRPDVNKVEKLISRGASIILNDINKHNEGLTSLTEAFQKLTNGRCQGNLYFSMESHQAFGPHFDTHDVFAIHFEGEKVWNIYENIEIDPINHPIFKYGIDERNKKAGKLIDQVTLKPGDLLYIPRGQYHDALASKNGAIHIAFGLTYFKPIDLMSVLWEKLVINDYMRSDIKPTDNMSELKDVTSKIVKELETIVKNDETTNILKNSFKHWPYKNSNYNLKSIMDEGKRYFVSKNIRLEENKSEIYLTNGKSKVMVPNQFLSLTKFIMKQEYFTFKSLSSSFKSIPIETVSECLESLKKMQVIK